MKILPRRIWLSGLLAFSVILLIVEGGQPLGVAQQTTSTYTAPVTQSFGCQSGTCTWVIPPYTQTVGGSGGATTFSPTTFTQACDTSNGAPPGASCTYTLSSFVTAIYTQAGSTYAFPGTTITMTAPPITQASNTATPPSTILSLAIFASIVILAVAFLASRKPKQNEGIKIKLTKPTPSDATLDGKVLSYVTSHHGEISISQASRDLGIGESQLKDSLSRLVAKGAISK